MIKAFFTVFDASFEKTSHLCPILQYGLVNVSNRNVFFILIKIHYSRRTSVDTKLRKLLRQNVLHFFDVLIVLGLECLGNRKRAFWAFLL